MVVAAPVVVPLVTLVVTISIIVVVEGPSVVTGLLEGVWLGFTTKTVVDVGLATAPVLLAVLTEVGVLVETEVIVTPSPFGVVAASTLVASKVDLLPIFIVTDLTMEVGMPEDGFTDTEILGEEMIRVALLADLVTSAVAMVVVGIVVASLPFIEDMGTLHTDKDEPARAVIVNAEAADEVTTKEEMIWVLLTTELMTALVGIAELVIEVASLSVIVDMGTVHTDDQEPAGERITDAVMLGEE
jgi:hypothetical protein